MKAWLDMIRLPGMGRIGAASVPADLADWMDFTALLVLLVYEWQAGPWSLALFTVCIGLPYVVIGPVAGALTDRTDIRMVMIASNLGRAACTIGFLFATSVPVLLGLVILRSSIDSAFTPARQAAMQALVPADALERANGLVFGINQATKIVGPGFGGLLLLALSAKSIFVLNAALSVVAALTLIGLKLPARPERDGAERAGFWRNVAVGFTTLVGNRVLVVALAVFAAGFFSLFLYDSLFGLLAQDFGFSPAMFAFANVAVGVGGVAGAIAAGSFGARGPMRMMAAGAALSGPITIALGLASLVDWPAPLALLLAGAFFLGAAVSFIVVPYRAIVQREVAPDRIARVVATGEAVTVTAMLSAPFIGAALADAFGIGSPFVAGGALMVVVALSALLARPHRRQPAAAHRASGSEIPEKP